MNASLPGQSVAELGRTLTETIDRVGQTGQAEMVTVDGQPRIVLLSVAAYEELTTEALSDADVRSMRRAIEQAERGETMEAGAFFDQLHAELLAMKGGRNEGTP